MKERFQQFGYMARTPELLALRSVLARPTGSVRAVLLEGSAGAGKTAFAEVTSKVLGGGYIYHLLHSWSDDQELFSGINVTAAVAGDVEAIQQDGVLAKAAKMSLSGEADRPVVVCLDEVDKVQERTENLLLDFLQTGRVPIAPGQHIQGNVRNMLIFLTSNGMRPLSSPLLRRVRRVYMTPLSVEVVESILQKKTNLPSGIVRLARKVAYALAEMEGRIPSLQEMENLLYEISIVETIEELQLAFGGWISFEKHIPDRNSIAPLWSEICKFRRSL